jgi:hypothetical protein
VSGGAEAQAVENGARSEGAHSGRLGALVFALLVLASFGAFFLAQRLKHIPTAVQALKLDPAFYPKGGGSPIAEPISFEIEREDRVTVEVLDTRGSRVATLAHARPLSAYTELDLRWNGRYGVRSAPHGLRSRGALAPEGEYRLRIKLLRRRLEVRSPSSIELVRPHT